MLSLGNVPNISHASEPFCVHIHLLAPWSVCFYYCHCWMIEKLRRDDFHRFHMEKPYLRPTFSIIRILPASATSPAFFYFGPTADRGSVPRRLLWSQEVVRLNGPGVQNPTHSSYSSPAWVKTTWIRKIKRRMWQGLLQKVTLPSVVN